MWGTHLLGRVPNAMDLPANVKSRIRRKKCKISLPFAGSSLDFVDTTTTCSPVEVIYIHS